MSDARTTNHRGLDEEEGHDKAAAHSVSERRLRRRERRQKMDPPPHRILSASASRRDPNVCVLPAEVESVNVCVSPLGGGVGRAG